MSMKELYLEKIVKELYLEKISKEAKNAKLKLFLLNGLSFGMHGNCSLICGNGLKLVLNI